jgi:16S rRNA (adenine1518-N6/adenine1519-N6)-dimethyltransferase
MNNAEKAVRELLKKYDIKAKKALGQNFLISDSIVFDIVDKAKINEKDLVIEIGPGLGTLTNELCKKAGKVIAIEIDPKMIEILKNNLSYDN